MVFVIANPPETSKITSPSESAVLNALSEELNPALGSLGHIDSEITAPLEEIAI